MKEQYGRFAYLYDRLMAEVDYLHWVDFIQSIIQEYNINPKEVLELACGTGNITIPMAERGYRITALDISQDMLTVAKEKAIESNVHITFIQQNMINFCTQHSYEAVICVCDGINYVTNNKQLKSVFANTYKALDENGVFIFDISSYYKLSSIIANNTFGESLGDLVYLWQNFYNDEAALLEMELTFFQEDKEGLYRRFEEYHKQKAHRADEIVNLLELVGYTDIKVFGDFLLQKPKDNTERIFFAAKKK
ncbi:class I SAM-dependent methyltransferase [Alkaliphilus pronyensis]|uniref:Class I SAM-dependent methyltransferase n=1 Tax=Alkaliphilus pronyensis TaxID=1482732 RepID=A0A6I0FA29_9FIRM|nr:class I SAM-dependent methyltransferase [Alkaliphilus pronyensis]KAB3535406.1 class I SAM-dependent methyltransferase [Alkaliphilus pronyensis]